MVREFLHCNRCEKNNLELDNGGGSYCTNCGYDSWNEKTNPYYTHKAEYILDQLMAEIYCSCGLPWVILNWNGLGNVRICNHNLKDVKLPEINETSAALKKSGFDSNFSSRRIYELGFKDGQSENIPYTACLNREKEYIENTKNAAQEMRSYLNLIYNGNPHKRHDLCSCENCRDYSQLMQIIGKMERYEYAKTN